MRVLLVVPPERTDFYGYLAAADDFQFLHLWQEKRSQFTVDPASLPVRFSSVHFWQDHSSPAKLLRALRPDKIVFFEIIDLRQIALAVAARAAGITTFFLDHGAAGDRGTAVTRWQETRFLRHKLPYLTKRALRALPDALSSKRFYYAQRRGLSLKGSRSKYMAMPIRMALAGPNEVLTRNIFRERVPRWSIVFNEVNFEEYQLYTGIDRSEAILTGLPFFDRYHRSDASDGDHIVFIDHPYLEGGLLDWTEDHHRRVVRAVEEIAEATGRRVIVKLHPRSDMSLWIAYGLDPAKVEVVQHGDFTDTFLGAALILGFSSSLLTGFLSARKKVVLLGWHPQPRIIGSDFSQTGLCHVSLCPDDIRDKIDLWLSENKAMDEAKHEAFLRKYNWPFDGRAGERVIEAIRSL